MTNDDQRLIEIGAYLADHESRPKSSDRCCGECSGGGCGALEDLRYLYDQVTKA